MVVKVKFPPNLLTRRLQTTITGRIHTNVKLSLDMDLADRVEEFCNSLSG